MIKPIEWLTLTGTSIALFFSLLSYFQKRGESYWATRKQLSDTLSRIGELNLEIAKHRTTPETARANFNLPGMLSDHRRYLVRHAALLAKRVRRTVTTHEYLIIAWAFDSADDVENARSFFEKAIEVRTDPVDHALALRSYARFLDNEHEADKAETQYNMALAALVGENDRLKYYRGDTFERRAVLERERGNLQKAQEYFAKARLEYESVKDEERHRRYLKNLARTETPAARIL